MDNGLLEPALPSGAFPYARAKRLNTRRGGPNGKYSATPAHANCCLQWQRVENLGPSMSIWPKRWHGIPDRRRKILCNQFCHIQGVLSWGSQRSGIPFDLFVEWWNYVAEYFPPTVYMYIHVHLQLYVLSYGIMGCIGVFDMVCLTVYVAWHEVLHAWIMFCV